MDYKRKIAEFMVQTRFGSMPPEASKVAKTALLDSVGVILAGGKNRQPIHLCKSDPSCFPLIGTRASSTRRFSCRPSGVSLLAIGR